jgi:hypothetical protein
VVRNESGQGAESDDDQRRSGRLMNSDAKCNQKRDGEYSAAATQKAHDEA